MLGYYDCLERFSVIYADVLPTSAPESLHRELYAYLRGVATNVSWDLFFTEELIHVDLVRKIHLIVIKYL